MPNLKIFKMKKIVILICTAFVSIGIFSCTPENIIDNGKTTQACCGEDILIPPPPPPPPPRGNGE